MSRHPISRAPCPLTAAVAALILPTTASHRIHWLAESKVEKSIVASHVRCPMTQRKMGTDADLRSSGASPCTRRMASMCTPAESASLKTRPPVACDLASVPMTQSSMSLHGQAELPMMPRGQSVSAAVPDGQGPSPWTRVAGRVWFAAVWPRSMYWGSSPRPCGKPVW